MRIKTIMVTCLVLTSVLTYELVKQSIKANYEFTNKYEYAWNLSDKSSTIVAKSIYIDQFVNLLSSNKQDFTQHNAIWLKTSDNNFDKNLEALITLRDRLNTIKTMDENSFAYQTAIQQITAQEQGQATKLISTLQGCYELQHYPFVWDWIGMVFIVLTIILGLVVVFMYGCYL